jgi:hypothetical protein
MTELITNWAELEAQPYGAQFTVGAEATNAIITEIQLLDREGTPLTKSVMVPWYIAGAATGLTIGHAASGAVAIANSRGLLISSVAKLAGYLVTNSSGRADISITESGALTSHLVLVMQSGQLAISGAITHAA